MFLFFPVGTGKFSLLSLGSEKNGKRKRIAAGLFCRARWTRNRSGWLVGSGTGRSGHGHACRASPSEEEREDSPDAGGDCDCEKYGRQNLGGTRRLIVRGVGRVIDDPVSTPCRIADDVQVVGDREANQAGLCLRDQCRIDMGDEDCKEAHEDILEPEDPASIPAAPIDSTCAHIVSSEARLSGGFSVVVQVVLWLRIEVCSESSFSITRGCVNRCMSHICRIVVVYAGARIVLIGRRRPRNYRLLRENNGQFELLSCKELVDTRRVAQCAI